MKMVKCDKCGKIIENDESTYIGYTTMGKHAKNKPPMAGLYDKVYDLCDDCYKSVAKELAKLDVKK